MQGFHRDTTNVCALLLTFLEMLPFRDAKTRAAETIFLDMNWDRADKKEPARAHGEWTCADHT